jgi:hypothetical protein
MYHITERVEVAGRRKPLFEPSAIGIRGNRDKGVFWLHSIRRKRAVYIQNLTTIEKDAPRKPILNTSDKTLTGQGNRRNTNMRNDNIQLQEIRCLGLSRPVREVGASRHENFEMTKPSTD